MRDEVDEEPNPHYVNLALVINCLSTCIACIVLTDYTYGVGDRLTEHNSALPYYCLTHWGGRRGQGKLLHSGWTTNIATGSKPP